MSLLPAAERLIPAYARFAGWSYGYPVAVPERLPGVPEAVPVAVEPSQRRTVCTGLTAWCLLAAYPQLRDAGGVWVDLQIANAARPWSPVERVAAVLGGSVLSEPQRGAWHLTQTWTGLRDGAVVDGARGHARIVRVDADGELTVYEASQTHGIRTRDYEPGAWLRWGARTRWAVLP